MCKERHFNVLLNFVRFVNRTEFYIVYSRTADGYDMFLNCIKMTLLPDFIRNGFRLRNGEVL